MSDEQTTDIRTRCARGVDRNLEIGRPLAPPVVISSTFGFEDQASIDRFYETGQGYVYSRYGNPTVREAERMVAGLEGAEDATCFASGMAAITTTFFSLARAGERVAAQRELYGGTVEFLEALSADMDVEVFWLEASELDRLEPDRLEGCRLLYLETPSNPTLRIVDLARVSRVGRQAGAVVAVDGTFGTPALQRPLSHGVDLVLHSATKYLGGHGDLIGGAVAGSSELVARIARRRKMLGGTMDPWSAFLLYRGMRTLAVRMDAHGRGAAEVARFLEEHAKVERVFYPGLTSHPEHDLAARQMDGFGGMVSFVVVGGAKAAAALHDRLTLFHKSGSLGGIESLVSIPARMSHRGLDPELRARAGVPDGMVRLSVGLEAPQDLVADLEQALA